MRKSAWGAAFFSIGLLAACGSKTPAASSSDANQSGGATDWPSICKAAKARAPRCGVSDQTVQDCEKIDGCTDHPYETNALPVLAKCLADSDCDACAKVSTASPLPAGKAFLATAGDYEKRCKRADDMAAVITKVGGLFNADSLKPFSDCMQMPSCDDAAGCIAKLHMGDMSVMANSQCTDILGLTATSAAASNTPPPPPPPDSSATAGGAGSIMNQPAPELSGSLVGKGKLPSIKSLNGKVVAVVFFATYSTASIQTVNDVAAFVKKNKKKGVTLIAVSEDDDNATVAAFQTKNHGGFPIVWDSKKSIGQTYSPHSLPDVFVIDRKGVVVDELGGVHPATDDIAKHL